MSTLAASPQQLTQQVLVDDSIVAAPRPRLTSKTAGPKGSRWLRVQSINLSRHAANLRPFTKGEFGTGAAAPTPGHLVATNALMRSLRSRLLRGAARLSQVADQAAAQPIAERLEKLLERKSSTHSAVQEIERVWEFYFGIFSQRQSRFGPWLVSCDRIALDCYQDAFTGLGVAKSIPAPPPFTHMRGGLSPATFRRNIFLRRLGQINPFPLVELPYHRLLNPWTLGAVLHEVSHNLQNELGLHKLIPRLLYRNLVGAGLPPGVAKVWRRWNRETFADMSGLLLGGPAVVASLLDVVARTPAATFGYNPRGVHPTPYLRPFLSFELLRRLGFEPEAGRYERMWTKMYPDPTKGNLPPALLQTAHKAIPIVVRTMCFDPYETLGNKKFSEVIRFSHKEQQIIEEAARRLAAGVDPGILPERYLIGAARAALDLKLAHPETITQNFYRDLSRR